MRPRHDRRHRILQAAVALGLAMIAPMPALGADAVAARAAVWSAEEAFARSMAERDFGAFGRHVADEAVFFGSRGVLRGKAAVLAGWKPFFEAAQAPFSWAPDQVEVLASGQLALSTGPVRNAQGEVVARFNSVWQRQPDGRWQVVFDKGSPKD